MASDPFSTPEDCAALVLTEAETHVPYEVYEEARDLFNEGQLAKILIAIVTFSVWNRVAVATRMVPEAS